MIPGNLIRLQRLQRVADLDAELADLAAEGYAAEVDRLLEERLELLREAEELVA